jgi:hypothetical protein
VSQCHATCTSAAAAAAAAARLQEPLLPTPTNINPIHLSSNELLAFISVQQWLAATLDVEQSLLQGMFVLVPAQQQQQQEVLAACNSSSDDGVHGAAVAAAVPWRLRQVSRVELCPGVDPAHATVTLVGGERVRAGAVKQGQLAEAQDHQVGLLYHTLQWLQFRCMQFQQHGCHVLMQTTPMNIECVCSELLCGSFGKMLPLLLLFCSTCVVRWRLCSSQGSCPSCACLTLRP